MPTKELRKTWSFHTRDHSVRKLELMVAILNNIIHPMRPGMPLMSRLQHLCIQTMIQSRDLIILLGAQKMSELD